MYPDEPWPEVEMSSRQDYAGGSLSRAHEGTYAGATQAGRFRGPNSWRLQFHWGLCVLFDGGGYSKPTTQRCTALLGLSIRPLTGTVDFVKLPRKRID